MTNNTLHNLLNAFAQGQTAFDNVLIKNANLQAQLLPFVSLRKACMPGANFRHAVLPGANFEGAIFRGSNFEHANLLAANLAWANLAQSDLGHTLLASANLVGINLANANLVGASMPGADLTSANLRNANLTGVNLKGANLSKANLFGARIDAKALSEAILEFTVMPNGECVTHPREQHPTMPNLANVMTYTRLAVALEPHRGIQPASSAPASSQANTQATAANPRQESVSSASSEAQQASKHIWFQFTENRADLDLTVTTAQKL
ncbi:pentapeptide repeat-containing protein [Leptolyngbya iicbica]|uniref:Pentapeptide repeat-containing protein n=2 Tax=Cyanophyceae TaxID=3028117 RepID=A0A4Q7E0K1_9CYAN|nr:pentapeptide repeat-containing protein [Leptolyngbya sp. LK]RZM74868.1 pentapeptide repeat-containing protein [Leptolyngbya sp. LK]